MPKVSNAEKAPKKEIQDRDEELYLKDPKDAYTRAKRLYFAGVPMTEIARAYGIPYSNLYQKVTKGSKTRRAWAHDRADHLRYLESEFGKLQMEQFEELNEASKLVVKKLKDAVAQMLADTSTMRWDEMQKATTILKDIQAMVRLEEGKATEIRESRQVVSVDEVLTALQEVQVGASNHQRDTEELPH